MPILRRHIVMPAILALGAYGAPTAAPSAIIIDDFDDSLEVISPKMGDEFITTENVNSLGATRQVRIGIAGGGNPEGRLSSNLTRASTLTGIVTRLNPSSSISLPLFITGRRT